jgi:hypothetical protein
MKVQGAAVSLGGKNFVVVLVGMEVVQSPGEADMAIDAMRPSFGGVPVVLMAQNEKGSPTYYGDEDLVRLLAGVPVDEMPWKEYPVG